MLIPESIPNNTLKVRQIFFHEIENLQKGAWENRTTGTARLECQEKKQ